MIQSLVWGYESFDSDLFLKEANIIQAVQVPVQG